MGASTGHRAEKSKQMAFGEVAGSMAQNFKKQIRPHRPLQDPNTKEVYRNRLDDIIWNKI